MCVSMWRYDDEINVSLANEGKMLSGVFCRRNDVLFCKSFNAF